MYQRGGFKLGDNPFNRCLISVRFVLGGGRQKGGCHPHFACLAYLMVEDGEKIGAWERNGHLTVQSVYEYLQC